MKILNFAMLITSLLGHAVFAETTAPPFPVNLPKAYKDISYLQNQMTEIGAMYCLEAKRAPGVLAKMTSPENKELLTKEIKIAAVVCRDEVFTGLPQTPGDGNLKVLTNQEILRLVTFRLFVLYKEVPGERGTSYFVIQRLRNYETVFSRDIIEAYTPPGGNEIYPLLPIADWVRAMHKYYGDL